MKLIYLIIWELSEWTGISLGRFAPAVLAGMVGLRKGTRIVTCQECGGDAPEGMWLCGWCRRQD